MFSQNLILGSKWHDQRLQVESCAVMTTCDRSQSLVPDLPPDSQGSAGGEYAGHRRIWTEAPSKPISICKQIRCIIVVNPLVTMLLFLKHWGSGCQEWLVPRSGLRSHLGPGQVLSKDLNLASNHQYIGNWHMKGSHLFGYTNGYQKTMIQEVGWEFAHTSSGYLMP